MGIGIHVRKDIINVLHITILLLALFLLVSMSYDIFKDNSIYRESSYLRIQYWICIWFLFCWFLEFLIAERRWHYLWTNFFFLIISVPYQAIVDHYHLDFSPDALYLLRFVPLIRGGYALSVVIGWFASNRISGMFITYLAVLMATVYFASLAFFELEYNVNPLVNSYGDSLWWASMNVTTVGSDIVAVTVTGKVLSFVLAAIGMMMFPIFTVYVTNVITETARNEIRRDTTVGSSNLNSQNSTQKDES